jgi:hypothetical protein
MTGKIIPTYDMKRETEAYLLVLPGLPTKILSQKHYDRLKEVPPVKQRKTPVRY